MTPRFQVTALVLFIAAALVHSAHGNFWIAALLYGAAALHAGPVIRAVRRYAQWVNEPSPRAPRAVPNYAKAGGPPQNWWCLEVMLNGNVLKDVVEVNTAEGWAVREALDANGAPVIEGDEIKTYRHKGAYTLRWINDKPRPPVWYTPLPHCRCVIEAKP